MTHLLIFVENYGLGGADKMARIYADNLDYDKVTIFYNHDDNTTILLKKPLANNISAIPYRLPTLANLGAFANRFKKFLPLFVFLKIFNLIIRYPYWIISCIYFFAYFLRIKPTDFIINNGSYPGGEWCRSSTIAAKIYTKLISHSGKIIHVVHNEATPPFFRLFKAIEFFIDFLIDKCSTIVCVSHQNAERLVNIRNINQTITVIYNGIQKQQLKKYPILKNRAYKILNVASINDRKNQILIMQAVYILKNYDIELHLVGEESECGYLDILKKYARDQNLKVFFHGFSDPINFYKECDIFILSSTREGFPLAPLEAMSCGLPVITTNCGGSAEQICKNYNGIILRNNTSQELAEAISLFVANPRLLEQMGKNAYNYVQENFSFEQMISQYKDILSK